MKRIALLLMMIGALATVQAEDTVYPYLTFETADGGKVSVSVSALAITVNDGVLKAGTQTFALSNLSRMYFSKTDETSDAAGIETVSTAVLNEALAIYDLQGRKVTKEQMRRSIYVIKTKTGTRKVNVK